LAAHSDVVDARWVPERELAGYDLTKGLLSVLQLGLSRSGSLDLSP
jgi:hypothetical protein